MSTTKQDPALCTKAPVVGVNNSMIERITAATLMHIDKVILNLIVVTVALDNFFKYGIF